MEGTDENHLRQFRKPEIKSLCEDILLYRHLRKELNTYTNKFKDDYLSLDGRIKSNFNPLGTATGRFSSNSPNLQNIPNSAEFRNLFIPAPENSMIVCDYSQVELRVAAELSGDKTMIKAFRENQDLHRLTASKVFNKTLSEVSKEERTAAKPINFGLIYNISANGLVQQLGKFGIEVNKSQARKFRKSFFDLYRGFNPYHRQLWIAVNHEFKNTGMVAFRTPRSGRRRWLLEHDVRWKDGGERHNVVYNSPIQGLSGDGLKQSLVILWERLKGTSAKILATVHDEIVLECSRHDAEEIKRIVEDSMIAGMQKYIWEVPIVAEATIGQSWADKD